MNPRTKIILNAIHNRKKKHNLDQMWVSKRALKYLPLGIRILFNIDYYNNLKHLKEIFEYNTRVYSERFTEEQNMKYIKSKKAYHLL